MMAIPITIKESARLKTGQIRKSMKSITTLNCMRSIRFPTAPLAMKIKAVFVSELSGPVFLKMEKSRIIVIIDKTIIIAFILGNKPKAIPGLRT